jgi:predicted transcriptional regulator
VGKADRQVTQPVAALDRRLLAGAAGMAVLGAGGNVRGRMARTTSGSRKGMLRGFGDLEAQIMERLWAAPEPVTVRQLVDDLQQGRAIAYTTVLTVTDILYRKEWLTRQRQGRAYAYRPVCTREQYAAGLMREALATSTDHTAALLHFVTEMPAEEAAALRDALAELDAGPDDRPEP